MEIYFVFYINLLQHEASDVLQGEHHGPQKLVIALDGVKELYGNRIFNSKYDCQFKPSLLCYFVDWKKNHLSWKLFYLMINYQFALNPYHAKNSTAEDSYIVLYNISHCQCAGTLQSLA